MRPLAHLTSTSQACQLSMSGHQNRLWEGPWMLYATVSLNSCLRRIRCSVNGSFKERSFLSSEKPASDQVRRQWFLKGERIPGKFLSSEKPAAPLPPPHSAPRTPACRHLQKPRLTSMRHKEPRFGAGAAGAHTTLCSSASGHGKNAAAAAGGAHARLFASGGARAAMARKPQVREGHANPCYLQSPQHGRPKLPGIRRQAWWCS